VLRGWALDNTTTLDISAILAPVVEGYGDLFSLARDLADRAAASGQLEPPEVLLHRQMLETAESQLASMRELLQVVRSEPV